MTLPLPRPDPITRPAVERCGAALTVFASQLLTSMTARHRVCGQILNAVASAVPISLRICDLGSDKVAAANYERVLHCLRDCFDGSGLDAATVEITVDAISLSPQRAWHDRLHALGAGPLNILIPDSLRGRETTTQPFWPGLNNAWHELWQLREHPVYPACWPTVSSPCPLLMAEAAADVVPGIGLQAPGQSAWLHAELDLGSVLFEASERAIDSMLAHATELVRLAEQQHDRAVWPTAAMQYDSWANRRVAIVVRGISSLVANWGLDTRNHADIRKLDALLRRLKQTLCVSSAAIAQTRELLPAIAATNPTERLPGSPARDDWERRWKRAVRRQPLRHRNLLAISPWSLAVDRGGQISNLNLLVLLKHADACVVRPRSRPKYRNEPDFLQFFRRTGAIRRHIEASRVVAERL